MSRPVGRAASAPAGCCSSTPETTRTPRTCQIVEETRCRIRHAPGGGWPSGAAGSPLVRLTGARSSPLPLTHFAQRRSHRHHDLRIGDGSGPAPDAARLPASPREQRHTANAPRPTDDPPSVRRARARATASSRVDRATTGSCAAAHRRNQSNATSAAHPERASPLRLASCLSTSSVMSRPWAGVMGVGGPFDVLRTCNGTHDRHVPTDPAWSRPGNWVEPPRSASHRRVRGGRPVAFPGGGFRTVSAALQDRFSTRGQCLTWRPTGRRLNSQATLARRAIGRLDTGREHPPSCASQLDGPSACSPPEHSLPA